MDLLYSSCRATGNVIELQNIFIFFTHYLTFFIIFYIYTHFNRMIKKKSVLSFLLLITLNNF